MIASRERVRCRVIALGFYHVLVRAGFRSLLLGLCSVVASVPAAAGGEDPAAREFRRLEPGDPAVSAAAVQPFETSLRRTLIREGVERPFGEIAWEVSATHGAGGPALREVLIETGPRGVVVIENAAPRKGFLPMTSRVYSTSGRFSDSTFDGKVLSGRRKAPGSGADEPYGLRLDRPAFNLAMIDMLLATLGLEVGDRIEMPVFFSEEDGVVTFEVQARKGEKIAGPGGVEIDVLVVEVKSREEEGAEEAPRWDTTYWLSPEPPYVLRTVERYPERGLEIRVELGQ